RDGALLLPAKDVLVHATDQSDVEANTGAASISLGAGVGGSIAINSVKNTVEAFTDGGSAEVSGGQIDIEGTSHIDINAFALGFGVGGTLGGFATVTSNTDKTTTDASVRHSGSLIGQTVTIHARDDSPLDADSASLAAGLLGGAGGSIARNVMGTAVRAGVGGAPLAPTAREMQTP